MGHPRVMGQAQIGMIGFATHPMGTIVRTVRIHNLPERGIVLTSLKAHICRKYMKRREKIETTREVSFVSI